MELCPTWVGAFENGGLAMVACLLGVLKFCFVSLLSGVCVFVEMRWVGDGGGEEGRTWWLSVAVVSEGYIDSRYDVLAISNVELPRRRQVGSQCTRCLCQEGSE